jgi:hypothetical protein
MAIRSLKTGQFSRSALVGNPVIMPGSYESIATTTLTTTASTITFSNIPQTFTHLQLRCIGQLNNADITATIRFNNDTSSTNISHYIQGDGSSVVSGVTSGNSDAKFIFRPSYTALGSNIFGVAVIDILDYATTVKNKVSRALTGYDANSSGSNGGYINFVSNLWVNTAAINRIDILTGNSFVANSQFALYGVN